VSARFRCGACESSTSVDPEADVFWCAACGCDNSFCECAHCRAWSVVASPYGLPPSGWTCELCGRANPRDHRPALTLDGFSVIAATHSQVNAGAACSLAADDGGITVALRNQPIEIRYPYRALEVFELSARRPKRSESAAGDSGRRVPPWATDAQLRLERGGEIVLVASTRRSLAELRTAFAEPLASWDATRPRAHSKAGFSDQVAELARLHRLRDEGCISSAEFQMVRVQIVRRLTGRRA
jgi:hypothetical protein